MRYFYLRFTPENLEVDANDPRIYRTGIVDLYDNSQYRNYSVLKSKYGLNLVGDSTWTGLNDHGESEDGKHHTSSGFVENGRYVDTSGRIDVTRHTIKLEGYTGATSEYEINYYSTENPQDSFPELWNSKSGIIQGRNIFRIDSERYARFEIVWADQVELANLDFEYIVSVEIDEPTVNPLFDRTRRLLSVFPEWMALRQDAEESDTPALATPNTLGGAVINAVAGQELDDLKVSMAYLKSQMFLDTADATQKDWVYIIENTPEYIYSIKGDGVELARTASAREFYDSSATDDVCFYMDIANTVWVNKEYSALEINGESRTAVPIHVWNWFDEHALLHDIERHYLESNESLRLRVKDVYVNQPGVSLERLKLTLRRALNLWITPEIGTPGATPDSYAPGATPTVLEIDDIIEMDEYFTADGLPTTKMKSLVAWLAKTYPTTWGNFRWGKAIWDPGGEDNTGYFTLPNLFDAEAVEGATPAPIQPGVGDMDDLYLYRPDEISLVTDFDYKLRIKGLELTVGTEYQEASMLVSVNGYADVDYYIDQAKADLTVWILANGIRYWSNITLDSGERAEFEPLTGPRQRASLDLIDDSGNLNTSLEWGIDGDSTVIYSPTLSGGPLRLSRQTISQMEIQLGTVFEYGATDPNAIPERAHLLRYPSATELEGSMPLTLPHVWMPVNETSDIAGTANKVEISDYDGEIELIADWDNSAPVRRPWRTQEQGLNVYMNGAAPNNDKRNFIYEPPPYVFPAGVVEGTQVWEISIVSKDESGRGAAFSETETKVPITIPRENVLINGLATWDDDDKMIIDYDPDTLFEFSTVDIPGVYPSEFRRWDPFTRLSDATYEGIVDENGAWFNGNPPNEEAGEERLRYHFVNRNDFGLPNNEVYMVTWMGVELVGSPDAVVYLNTNTVKPAFNVSPDLEYPQSAIEESWDTTNAMYVFSGFYVYARKKSRFNPQWDPFINSGWFYTAEDEYYLYADKIEESFTTNSFALTEQTNMGAPIMVWSGDVQLNQVAFMQDYATPVASDTNVEIVRGNGSTELYLSYEDVFDVEVVDTYTKEFLAIGLDSPTNVIALARQTDFDTEYEVSYKVNNSFYIDHHHIDDGGNLTSQLHIVQATPSGDYRVVYEGSDYNFATPIDLPLNPFYTLQEEGFIFISYDEYPLGSVMVRVNPGHIASSSEDYVLITIYAGDDYGNPKPDQTFTVSSDWGELSVPSVTTDRDGYGFVILTGWDDIVTQEATVTVVHATGVVGQVTVNVGSPVVPTHTLAALTTADAIPADGRSNVTIYGRVLDDGSLPVPYAVINYRRGRSIKTLFQSEYEGQVVADEFGKFVVGPFTASQPDDPGTVFVALESWSAGEAPIGPAATPNYGMATQYGPIGDIVFWREYPSSEKFLNELSQLPLDMEMHVEEDAFFLTRDVAFPVGYDETSPLQDATPSLTFDWDVPRWYAISAYKQYQLGLRGDRHYEAYYYTIGSHPDYEDF